MKKRDAMGVPQFSWLSVLRAVVRRYIRRTPARIGTTLEASCFLGSTKSEQKLAIASQMTAV